ncbi:hypothetical protein QJS66_11400 [Kocuria rhizophila]|nr:hypothetical protein QJS66_11400 [Kocuria rhizophila]
MTIMDTTPGPRHPQDTFRAGLRGRRLAAAHPGRRHHGPGPAGRGAGVVPGVAAAAGRSPGSSSPETGTAGCASPPVNGTRLLERTDYVASFPQLLGTISAFEGDDKTLRQLLATYEDKGGLVLQLTPAGHALRPGRVPPAVRVPGRLAGGRRRVRADGRVLPPRAQPGTPCARDGSGCRGGVSRHAPAGAGARERWLAAGRCCARWGSPWRRTPRTTRSSVARASCSARVSARRS